MSDLIGAAMSGDTGDLIKDTTTRNFGEDVIAASQEVPVFVDFWAPWCGPCMQLGPAIEKAVTEAAGAVKLVKLNIDDNPEIAQQMGIQSIPAVFAFKNGKPVDSFVGAVPESEIKAFLKRLVGDIGPSPIEQALEQAPAPAESGDLGAAANISTRARAPTAAMGRDVIGTTKPWPIEIKLVKAEKRLEITFDGGEGLSLPAELLLVESPSAEVQGHGPDQRVIVAAKRNVAINDLESIGNYAVRIIFDDTHDTGIYSWDYLYELGQRQDELWKRYLQALEEKGLSWDA